MNSTEKHRGYSYQIRVWGGVKMIHWGHFFGFAGRKPVVVYNQRHSVDLDHMVAHPIDALPAYADLTDFLSRRGSGEACFAS